MPDLLMCYLDRVAHYYRWTAVFKISGVLSIHKFRVIDIDSEIAAAKLGIIVERVLSMYSKEYGR
jgi:hypothetical protein